MKISRALKENVSTKISQESMKRVKRLESIIPVMGPPAIFIRLKVNHPKIKKIVGEMVCRYLSCIILDRQDSSNDYVKRIILKSMYGPDGAQNWVYVNNLRLKDEEEENEFLLSARREGGKWKFTTLQKSEIGRSGC